MYLERRVGIDRISEKSSVNQYKKLGPLSNTLLLRCGAILQSSLMTQILTTESFSRPELILDILFYLRCSQFMHILAVYI
jgi:hypothetical protein